MTANRPHNVYTRRDYTKPWALEATFPDKTLANSYVWHLEEQSTWDYEIRPARTGHLYYGFALVGVALVFAVVTVIALLVWGA